MSRLPRPRIELEERLVSEWTAKYHKGSHVKLRARLGPLPAAAEELAREGISPMAYTVTRRWADAIIFRPERTMLVEAKIKLTPDALGQILVYKEEFYETFEYATRRSLPLSLVVLYAFGEERLIKMFQEKGIRCIRYCPDWAKEAYLKRLRRP